MLGVLGGCGDMIKYFCDIYGDRCNCPKKGHTRLRFFGRSIQMCDKCVRRFYDLYMEMKKENNE